MITKFMVLDTLWSIENRWVPSATRKGIFLCVHDNSLTLSKDSRKQLIIVGDLWHHRRNQGTAHPLLSLSWFHPLTRKSKDASVYVSLCIFCIYEGGGRDGETDSVAYLEVYLITSVNSTCPSFTPSSNMPWGHHAGSTMSYDTTTWVSKPRNKPCHSEWQQGLWPSFLVLRYSSLYLQMWVITLSAPIPESCCFSAKECTEKPFEI